jgi:hypothetical protein
MELIYLDSETAHRHWLMWVSYESNSFELGMHHQLHLLKELDECDELWNSMTFEEREQYINRGDLARGVNLSEERYAKV